MNKAKIKGRIVSSPKTVYRKDGSDFFRVKLEIPRKSGQMDIVPLITDDYDKINCFGETVAVEGEVRSHTSPDIFGKNINSYIFPCKFLLPEEVGDGTNEIRISGKIVRKRQIRTTPKGRRIINYSLCVHDDNSDASVDDIIPCIAWEDNADIINLCERQDEIEITARFQSRVEKRKQDTELETRNVYEMSTNQIIL